MSDDEFATLFDERYEITNFGNRNVFIQEFDKEVFEQHAQQVPSKTHSESTLTRSQPPLYKIKVNDVETDSGNVQKSIRSNSYGGVPVALKRIAIKHKNVITAKFLSLNKYLLLVNNGYDFIGDYCSDISSSIEMLNVSNEVVSVSSSLDSPIGIVFKYYPNIAVSAKGNNIVVPQKGNVEVQ